MSDITGVLFDIKEFALHDGPGLRTTVFLKGCPLRCAWCHNPEGLSPEPQVIRGAAGERVAGTRYTAARLAAILNGQADLLRAGGGGVTFSGGEPLMQADFLAEVIARLDRTHTLLETSGYASERALALIAPRCDLVYYDLKLMDAAAHRRYCGADNAPILRNLAALGAMGVPFVIRVPLVPGVTDTDENLAAIAAHARGLSGLRGVELLPYNRAAGGKYSAVGMAFAPPYDETQPVHANLAPFERAGVPARVVE